VQKALEETRMVVKDSNGATLSEGDSVQVIKDLKVKGSSAVVKRGTVFKNIHLTETECRSAQIKGLMLKTEFVKKA
jgi:protein PhnA